MITNDDEDAKTGLLPGLTDVAAIRLLLADMHDDLPGRIGRLRYLSDIAADLGTEGTMLWGGQTTYFAWAEARSSFIHGNYVATIILCQSLAENLLAAFASDGSDEDKRARVQFRETLDRCHEIGLLSDQDVDDLKRLTSLRNPLAHFRGIDDEHNLNRRSMAADLPSEELIRSDAWFAIGLSVRLLAKKPFRVG